MATPTSISAVETKNISVLFYVRSNGQIACLTAQKSGQDPSNPFYKATNVTLQGNMVSSVAPQVSAVAYDNAGTKEVRVYYIDNSKSGGYQLKELCQTNGGEWYAGILDKNNFSVSPNSLLSANVENGQGNLAVFHQKGDSKDPWVAWVVLGQSTWSQTQISDRF